MAADNPIEGTQAALRAFLSSGLEAGFTLLDSARSADSPEHCEALIQKSIEHLSAVRRLEDLVDDPLAHAPIHKRADELEFAIAYFHQRRDENSSHLR